MIPGLTGGCIKASTKFSEGGPGAGKSLVGEVVAQVEPLDGFPESGRIVPEFELPHLREIIYPPVRIVYRIDGVRISIIRVWRSERVLKVPDGGIVK